MLMSLTRTYLLVHRGASGKPSNWNHVFNPGLCAGLQVHVEQNQIKIVYLSYCACEESGGLPFSALTDETHPPL
jgi:hypothetical protein